MHILLFIYLFQVNKTDNQCQTSMKWVKALFQLCIYLIPLTAVHVGHLLVLNLPHSHRFKQGWYSMYFKWFVYLIPDGSTSWLGLSLTNT